MTLIDGTLIMVDNPAHPGLIRQESVKSIEEPYVKLRDLYAQYHNGHLVELMQERAR